MQNPSTAPASERGPAPSLGFIPEAMFVAGIWSTVSYPSSLGFAKAGPRSGAGTGN